MKIRHLLVVAAATAMAADASAFEWSPVITQPNQSVDVTYVSAAEILSFNSGPIQGVAITDVMPKWIDDNETEITAVSGVQDPWDWDPNEFQYKFNVADFKGNGEYKLVFPEGMLVNGEGEKSDALEFYYTFDIPEFAPPMFEDFKVISITPDLSQPQALWSDQLMTIDTNHNDAIGVTTLTVTDTTTGDVFESSNFATGRTLGDASPVSWEVANIHKFFEGHDYKAEIVFYNGENEYGEGGVPTKIVDRVSYEFTGLVEAYKYSDITLDGVDPMPGSDFIISEPDQAVFTFLFSGPVNVYKALTPLGQNGQVVYPASCLSSNKEQTVWTLNISDQEYLKTVQTQLTIDIYARDLDGLQVHGEEGEDADSHFEFNWQCEVGAKPIVIVSPANGANIASLEEVIVKSADGDAMTWSWNGEGMILDQYDTPIGTLVYEEPAEGEDAAATEFRFTRMLDEFWNTVPLTNLAEGFYTIKFGPACFNFGEQFDDALSRSVTSSFTISANTQEGLEYISVVPEIGEPVKILDKILVKFGEPVGFEEDYFEVNVYNTDQAVVTTAKARMDFMEPTLLVITLDDPVTEAGRYMVVIPAGKIYNADYFESDGEAGLVNPMYSLFFVVGDDSEQPGVDPAEQEVFNYTEVDPADGAVVDELSHISLTFPDVVVTANDAAYVYKADALDSDPVTGAAVNWDFFDETLINVDLTTPIKDAGEYVVVIPARTICNEEFFGSEGKNGICNPEIRLRYTVGPENSLNYKVLPIEGDVAELHTFEITFEDTDNAFWLISNINDNPDIAPVLTCNGEPSVDISNLYSSDNVLYAAVSQVTSVKVDGTYVLTIPAESYFLEGVESREIILVYNLDTALAVKAVFGENVNADVYDVNGRLVIRNANASDLLGLRGVFVINGKKYILR